MGCEPGVRNWTKEFKDRADATVIGYYQPSLDDVGDYLTSFVAELRVEIVHDIHLSLGYEIEYDADPPEGVERQDTTTRTSLSWEF